MPFRLFIILLLATFTANAQQAFLFASQEDFLNSKPLRSEVTVKRTIYDNSEWTGPCLYEITVPGNYDLTKALDEYYFAIEYHDSLFLNCDPIIHVDGYANVLFRSGNYLYFTAVGSKLKAHKKEVRKGNKERNKELQDAVVVGSLIGGIPGGVLIGTTASDIASKSFSYLYDMNTTNAELLTPEILKRLLQKRPDLLDLYIKSNEPDTDGTYYWYLSKLFELE